MKNNMSIKGASVCALLVMLAVAMVAPTAEAAGGCNPRELRPCTWAIMSLTAPSSKCCVKVREQRTCLCEYLRQPHLWPFFNSPNTRLVASSCGVPFPRRC
ncbi:non-specific lipid-transfer protein AKCS9-like [Tripterygium wilfordii]|uniref:Non-specific lipid-transfer protein AKCS9-like n=1 Tax=Tripterygium wilfordii TaxID=458696 RepID=A0A7J7DV22_TRIWF|nr:non-specific lipid-transfer protein AKCS9-like [Tripterygium wilfordii]